MTTPTGTVESGGSAVAPSPKRKKRGCEKLYTSACTYGFKIIKGHIKMCVALVGARVLVSGVATRIQIRAVWPIRRSTAYQIAYDFISTILYSTPENG